MDMTELPCWEESIATLGGVEKLIKLELLGLGMVSTTISDISAIAPLTELKELHLHDKLHLHDNSVTPSD